MLFFSAIISVFLVSVFGGFALMSTARAGTISVLFSTILALISAFVLEIPHGAVTPVEVGTIVFVALVGSSLLGILSGRFTRKMRDKHRGASKG